MTQTALLKRLSLDLVNPIATDWEPKAVAKTHKEMQKASGLTASYKDLVAYEIAERINITALTPAIENLCANYIHDSMAGFINFGMNEYSYNGIGLGKFRSIFKGND